MLLTLATLMVGTLASEDLACVAAGLLIQRGSLGAASGVAACTLGIVAGDVGLWAIGRAFGAVALEWSWVARRLGAKRALDLRTWLERRAAWAIVGSRFVPGTRLPLYVTAGVLRLPGRVFVLWALVGALLWTPVLVLLSAGFGGTLEAGASAAFGSGWAAWIAIVVSLSLVLRVARALTRGSVRVRVAARLARWSRWEFWPMWLFYAPVALWVGLLALRHRGLSTVTASNPGIPDGGTVGESKFEILRRLPSAWTIPSALVDAGELSIRAQRVCDHMTRAGWSFPIVLKPDVGQRGAGVRLIRAPDEIERYLSEQTGRVVMQPYHEGPFEAGVFYYRMLGWERGRILSITDKHFPVLVGDGHSTIEELVWAHPRYRMQADTFLRRHHDVLARVLAAGDRFQLAIAGNHAQGTLFRDGRHLLTPALERRIDEIAQSHHGFFVGRFDIRYRDVDAFKAGEDLAIVELNGATAESTNIYDPDGSLRDAYRQLFRQWSIVFAIGAANRAAGATVSSLRRLAELVRAHWTTHIAFALSD
jgi:membrane protein DedA with SNARE-associated domain